MQVKKFKKINSDTFGTVSTSVIDACSPEVIQEAIHYLRSPWF